MKNSRRSVFMIILSVILVFIIVILCNYYQKPDTDNKPVTTVSQTASTSGLPENPINFKESKKKNKDIFSWIRIDNTNIDYPVFYPGNKSNDYYLRRNIDKNYDRQGVIFIENYNKTDWSDPVTLVYGHNIWTMGTMFYELKKFREKDFFDENRYINIYAKGRALQYEVYSAFEYDDRHIMKSFDFSDKRVFKGFIDYTLNPKTETKNVRKNTSVTTDDKIIVLSTCIKNKKDKRYLVVGVLRKDEKTK